MANKIRFKRGNKSQLPALEDGEPGVCLDTRQLFVGIGGKNEEFAPAYTVSRVDSRLNSVRNALMDTIMKKSDKKKPFAATFLAANWSATAPFTQTVNVAGMVADGLPLVDKTTFTQAQNEEYNKINGGITTASGSITATCLTDKPVADIPIRIEVVY
ncbi:MAG: hypothetical protein RR710_05275 [Oscillospiraceae bacterium]